MSTEELDAVWYLTAFDVIAVLGGVVVPLDSPECMQVVSQYSSLLAPLAVDAVLNVRDLDRPDSVDLRDIKVLRKLGGTVSFYRLCVPDNELCLIVIFGLLIC